MITRGEERRGDPSGANSAVRALLEKALFASFVDGRFLKNLSIFFGMKIEVRGGWG